MSSERNDDIDNKTPKFLYAFTKNILKSDKSIRWVAITDQDGIILNEQNRKGVKLLLTKEENQELIFSNYFLGITFPAILLFISDFNQFLLLFYHYFYCLHLHDK